MSGRPGAASVPGGADAGEAGLTPAAAGTGQDAGAAGPAAGTGGGLAGIDSDPDAGLAGVDPDRNAGLAGIDPDPDARLAGIDPDHDAGVAGVDPDPESELADIEQDAGHDLAATGPDAGAGLAETGPRTSAAPAGTGPRTGAAPAGTGPRAEVAATTRARVMAGWLAGGWPLRRTFLVGFVIVTLFSLAAIVVGGTALANLASARDRVVNKIDPAAFRTSQLGVAYLNQETGVRGYALSARPTFLAPYNEGLAQERRQVSALRRLLTGMPVASADLTRVTARAGIWRARYAEPTIRQVRTTGQPVTGATTNQGKAEFDALRTALGGMQADLTTERRQAVTGLNGSATTLNAICLGIGISLLVILIVIAFILEISVIRPLSRLAADARTVADGDFTHHVDPGGPQEVRTTGIGVNRMRERILAELSAVRAAHTSLEAAHATLEARTEDLQRSNAELEQFAYVASHDLQEPLRKVASFVQLLQRRYAGQLDEKADQYIDLAVDGAKRMQQLINDLLAFSRVGRTAQRREEVSCSVLLAQAWANLGPAAKASHATIEAGHLPVVLGETSLLTAVFQNLLSNALKFAGEQPPRISVSAHREGEQWLFSFSDNGIGIPAEYAERIFVIFQRLHDRAAYPGTGIGLAMCRKIIEYHGGRIWLDTTVTSGARFCFTLPARPEDADAHD
ncbi:MAG TPA: ATP-binding protein [Streptosporangiaceae bacterium]|nr:ATP-binding protein [Streptosporangiaceae bacterium]